MVHDAPPPVPVDLDPPFDPGEPERRRPSGARTVHFVVLGLVGFVILCGVVGTVAIIVPQMEERQARFTCQNQLSQVGFSYVTYRSEVPLGKGESFVDWLRGRVAPRGDLFTPCPGDEGSAMRPSGKVSFALRDFDRFPIDLHSTLPQAIAACADADGLPRHRDGTNVAYDDGSARFLSKLELGLGPDDPITFGPDSKSELLRPLVEVDFSPR